MKRVYFTSALDPPSLYNIHLYLETGESILSILLLKAETLLEAGRVKVGRKT
jgi:hypothetical protein